MCESAKINIDVIQKYGRPVSSLRAAEGGARHLIFLLRGQSFEGLSFINRATLFRGRRKEEGGRRKEEGGRRKEEGGRRKEEGGRKKVA